MYANCKCGHVAQTHMHNLTGEMFGSTFGRCVYCKCANYDPEEKINDSCPNCGETREIAKIKGCLRCLKCHWKEDCHGW